jgi:hypothetical protein
MYESVRLIKEGAVVEFQITAVGEDEEACITGKTLLK